MSVGYKQQRKKWSYKNPVGIEFGMGIFEKIFEKTIGKRIVITCSSGGVKRGIVNIITERYGHRIIDVISDVRPNMSELDKKIKVLRGEKPDMLIAIGGGSIIDSGKALGFGISQNESFSYFDYFAKNKNKTHAKLRYAVPLIAVPTTAGTGSEVTPFAVLWDRKQGRKYSLNHPSLYPERAVLDPLLTVTLPKEITISTGLDALSQCFEATWNRNACVLSDAYAKQGIRQIMKYLPVAVNDPGNIDARVVMMQSSLLSGLAISHTRTAIAHSMSYPLTGRLGLPHGFACSFTLPAVIRFNADHASKVINNLAKELGYKDSYQLSNAIQSLLDMLCVAEYVHRYVPSIDSVLDLVGEMYSPDRADNNLREVTRDDIIHLIEQSRSGLGF